MTASFLDPKYRNALGNDSNRWTRTETVILTERRSLHLFSRCIKVEVKEGDRNAGPGPVKVIDRVVKNDRVIDRVVKNDRASMIANDNLCMQEHIRNPPLVTNSRRVF